MPLAGILRQTEHCPRAKMIYFVSAYYDGLGPRRMYFKIKNDIFYTFRNDTSETNSHLWMEALPRCDWNNGIQIHTKQMNKHNVT